MADLNTDIRYIKGIGETRAKALHKLGIATLGDLPEAEKWFRYCSTTGSGTRRVPGF